MEKGAVKDLLYGGLTELMNDKRYYYSSSIGSEYNHFTDEGKEALIEFMNTMGATMRRSETAELDKRAKDLVLKGLKADSTHDKTC